PPRGKKEECSIDQILDAKEYYQPLLNLTMSYANKGWHKEAIVTVLETAFKGALKSRPDQDMEVYEERFKSIGRMTDSAIGKVRSESKGKITTLAQLDREYEITKEDTSNINTQWAYKGIIHEGAIVTIAAPAGGGKTGIFFYGICPAMVKNGYDVRYVDMDSPAKDFEQMRGFAAENNFKVYNPDLKTGMSISEFMKSLDDISHQSSDLSGSVFVIDTMKKVAELMRKQHTADLYKLFYRLSTQGATIILLGHTNKYKSDGELIFEGVGDVMSDTHDLIYLYSYRPNDREQIASFYLSPPARS
ncbi:MAG: hypothetical protein GY702_28825, partial [Desulfobulbaceae bacterium]|nr:hypothetical protein [Desulfobulbaceae bacterium]